MADGKPWEVPATSDDPAILEEIRHALVENNIGLSGNRGR